MVLLCELATLKPQQVGKYFQAVMDISLLGIKANLN